MLSPALDLRLNRKQYETVQPISLVISARRESQSKSDFPRKLNISHNRLEILPTDFLVSLANIVELDVSDNRLKLISPGLSHLPALKVLDARGNSLQELPKDIAQCPSIEEINLGDNQFDQFPPEFLDMPHLKQLYLGSNKIAKLPAEIKKMSGWVVMQNSMYIYHSMIACMVIGNYVIVLVLAWCRTSVICGIFLKLLQSDAGS